MEVLIKLNPIEAKTAISSGTMLALIEVVESTEQSSEKEIKAAGAIALETKKSEIKAESETKTEEIKKSIEQDSQPEDEKNTEPPITFTLEQVRGKLAALSQSGKQAQVKALIAKFGASKLTDIAKEDYAALMKEAEAI